ncbi:MAG TPA: type IX secretion system membrane protein PorP/SprF [Cytophagaceae bacterium]|jgi:type IX secretion system PorP/SprF family membrane protein|nr:type IX secretion system membrane protein PorP/SprF [Cytophagaceae bacterium]
MNILNKFIFIIAFILIGSSLQAQQQGQYSQYMMNYFLVNPAAGGTEDNIDFRSGYRNQWSGIAGSPKDYYASVNLPINKLHSKHRKLRKKADAYPVIGAMFSGQKLASLSHNTGYLTYSYHLPLTAQWILSMGAMAGFNQITLGDLNFIDNVPDPAVGLTKTKFDMSMGLWLYSKNIFMGISSMQILQNKVEFSSASSGKGVLNRHFYLTGGYKIQVGDQIKIIPSLFLKRTETAFQMDINTKVRFKDLFWGGLSYRKADAVVFLAGVGIPLTNSRKGSGYKGSGHGNDTRLEIGYSYDAGISKLRTYSNGSHEIMVALILPTGGSVKSPSDYW